MVEHPAVIKRSSKWKHLDEHAAKSGKPKEETLRQSRARERKLLCVETLHGTPKSK